MGFNVLNKLSEKCDINITHSKFDAFYGTGTIKGKQVVLVKPQTYMNLSGNSVIKFKKFYKISAEQIIVIYDDMDLSIGDIRIRKQGSSGSHNGMKSVIENLQTEEFARVRVGIGAPEYKGDAVNYVIGPIPKKEKEILDDAVSKATEAVVYILENGIDAAMNKYN